MSASYTKTVTDLKKQNEKNMMCSRNNKHVHLFMCPYTSPPNTYSLWTCLLETNLHLLMYPYTPRLNIYSHWTYLHKIVDMVQSW